MSYNPGELESLLDVFADMDLSNAILEMNMCTVVTHSFWLKKFRNVISAALGLSLALRYFPYTQPGRSTVIVGSPWEVPTMKEICSNIDKVDVLFVDVPRYSLLMSCYVIYRKLVRPGGIIVLANSCGADKYAARFIDDLRSGYVDGYKHELQIIRSGESSISYEVVKPELGAANVYYRVENRRRNQLWSNIWTMVSILFATLKWMARRILRI